MQIYDIEKGLSSLNFLDVLGKIFSLNKSLQKTKVFECNNQAIWLFNKNFNGGNSSLVFFGNSDETKK